ncbi:polysaccharide biosynthesis protein [Bacteroidota bacterium]
MIRSYFINYAQKNASRWLVLCIDVFLVIQTYFLAYFIKFNFSFQFELEQLFYAIPIVVVLATLSFLMTGSYKGIIRHTGIKDALNVYVGVSLLCGFMVLSVLVNKSFGFYRAFEIPISVIVIHYLLNIILLITSRFVFKTLYRNIISNLKEARAVLIYGAGEMGAIILSTLQKDTNTAYKVIGFIDDGDNKIGKRIDRLPIFSPLAITDKFVAENHIKEVIIAIQNIKPQHILEILDDMYSLEVKVKIAPPISKWVDGDINVGQIKQIKIEDLLERSPINLNNPQIKEELFAKTIFITGAAGSIGSEISKQISNYEYKKLVLIDQSESAIYDLEQELKRNHKTDFKAHVTDVRDLESMEALFNKYKPNYVYHAAAYKHVPLMEENPYEAVKINVNGTKNIADLALKYKADKFVMVSTDKAVNPTNVMGATKRVAEMYVTCLSKKSKGDTKFITTRFGNVLGSNGSVIPLFKKQIEEGGPLTLTHKEITRFFMTIPEACQLVIEAGSMGKGGEIFIFDMGESVKIFDLAKKMIQLSGLRYPQDVDIEITGLRPGEKLYEELLNDGENTLPTHHEKIMIGKVLEKDCEMTIERINQLCTENKVTDFDKTVERIKGIVPEYISQNSVYSHLDK